jgi:hypothetical protein
MPISAAATIAAFGIRHSAVKFTGRQPGGKNPHFDLSAGFSRRS